MQDFPEWLSIVEYEPTQQGGAHQDDNLHGGDTETIDTERIQRKIKEIFEGQRGGARKSTKKVKKSSKKASKKKASRKASSKKSSSKKSSSKKSSSRVSSGNPTFDEYRKLATHIGDTLGLPKGVKDRAPVHGIIKKITAQLESQFSDLPKIEMYKKVKKVFDENPKAYK